MKVKLFFVALTVGFFSFIMNAEAGLLVKVTANPYITPGYDINTTTSGKVLYYIQNLSSSDRILEDFSLYFESDVFASFNFYGPAPSGFFKSGNYIYGTGLSLNPGESILLYVEYTLYGPASTLDWDEGDPWEQGWYAEGSGLFPGNSAGGSTALTPEPNTLLLLGAGLFGLGARARRRKKKLQNS